MALTRLGLNQSINLATNITGTLATGNGGTGATSFSPGKVLQVINGINATIDGTNSNTLANTSTTASITPSSTSSKVLVLVKINGVYVSHQSTSLDLTLRRDSTTICDFGGTVGYNTNEANIDGGYTGDGITFLDTPNSTSSLEYRVQFATSVDGATYRITINNYIRGSIRPKSSITLMEIGA
jgi:hypothetical protein